MRRHTKAYETVIALRISADEHRGQRGCCAHLNRRRVIRAAVPR